ncbi:TIGR03943 family protein [Pseudonocardia sp.]|uniref:TIGR03943 family putative permease subunit n=1 Tax=Pseudonocardia sp. TaxID=60912 RepID=UPI0031FD8105
MTGRAAVGPVLLFVLGVVVVRLTLTGEFLNFVKPGHRWWLLAVGAGLVVLGIAGTVREMRQPCTEAAEPARSRLHTRGPLALAPEVLEAHRRAEGHDHSRVPGIAWLLLLPILLVFLVPPPALGAFAAGRAGADVPKPPSSARFEPLGGPDPARPSVYDYAERAAWDDGRTLAGLSVELTGFVTPRPDGGWYLSRLRISCCAADARAYLVEVVGAPKDYPANTWVDVTGTYLASEPGARVARLTASRVRTIDAPAETYEQ